MRLIAEKRYPGNPPGRSRDGTGGQRRIHEHGKNHGGYLGVPRSL
jgi:hypothetical protein